MLSLPHSKAIMASWSSSSVSIQVFATILVSFILSAIKLKPRAGDQIWLLSHHPDWKLRMILESLAEFVMTPCILGHAPAVLIYKLWQRDWGTVCNHVPRRCLVSDVQSQTASVQKSSRATAEGCMRQLTGCSALNPVSAQGMLWITLENRHPNTAPWQPTESQ